MNCATCGRGFHSECTKCLKGKCHKKEKKSAPVAEGNSGARLHGSTAKDLRDPKSTGRKRAAELYPLNRSEACEWRGQKNCGGGKRPIIGCVDGLQQHRHHGPVKDTTRNHEGNVHRICTRCHNHWHELNDLVYDQRAYGLLPHDPEPASPEELAADIFAWSSGEMGRKFELASSKKKLDNKHE